MKKYIIPALAVLLAVSVGFNIWQYAKAEQERKGREDRFVAIFLRKLDETCDDLESLLKKSDATKENTTFVTASMRTLEAMIESNRELCRPSMSYDKFGNLGIVYSSGSFSSKFAVENIWEDGVFSEAERQFTQELVMELERIASDVEADFAQEGRMNALWNALDAFYETMDDAEKSPYRLISNDPELKPAA